MAVHLTDADKDQMEELERQIREFTVPSSGGVEASGEQMEKSEVERIDVTEGK